MSRKQKLSNFGWLIFGVRPKNPKKNWAKSSENGCVVQTDQPNQQSKLT
jgi:hypothetical protein